MPVYETPADKAAEVRNINEFCTVWNCVPKFQPKFARVDAIAMRNKIDVGLIESKVRDEKFRTLAISYDKIKAAIAMSEEMRLPFILLIQWPVIGIHWMRVYHERIEAINYDGARKSREPELMAHFPTCLFRKLAGPCRQEF